MSGMRTALTALAIVLAAPFAAAQTSQAPEETSVVPQAPEAQLLGGVAAIVNDEVISISDVAQRARLLLITLGVPVSPENLQQALPRALDELIDERLQLQKAAEFDLKVDDEDVTAAVRDIAAQNQTSIDDLYASLSASGVNPQTLQDQMRAEIAWRRIVNGLFGSRIRISQLQIDGMMNRIEASQGQERAQLSEIFLFAPTEADKTQALQAANVIISQLQQGARFQLAAQQYSNSPTAAVGGDLGWVSPDELEPEVRAVLENVTPPALTTPITVSDGVYVYAVRAKQDGSTGEAQVTLSQVLSPEGSRAILNALSLSQPACADLESAATAEGLIHAELGTVPEAALTDEVRLAIQNVPEGGASSIVDTPSGPAILFVCDRTIGAAGMPDRDQVQNRLFNQQLTMLSQRELRDLKREATIIRR